MSDSDNGEVRDAGYADLVDAITEGEGYYLNCANGHGSLPPRHACPDCGSQELDEEPLPETGEIETFTVIYASTPAFAGDTPYVTAVVDFGPVRLTGQIHELNPDSVETGMTVTLDIAETETTGDRVIVFDPQ
jgi:uncharacterized OB-fold protein